MPFLACSRDSESNSLEERVFKELSFSISTLADLFYFNECDRFAGWVAERGNLHALPPIGELWCHNLGIIRIPSQGGKQPQNDSGRHCRFVDEAAT